MSHDFDRAAIYIMYGIQSKIRKYSVFQTSYRFQSCGCFVSLGQAKAEFMFWFTHGCMKNFQRQFLSTEGHQLHDSLPGPDVVFWFQTYSAFAQELTKYLGRTIAHKVNHNSGIEVEGSGPATIDVELEHN